MQTVTKQEQSKKIIKSISKRKGKYKEKRERNEMVKRGKDEKARQFNDNILLVIALVRWVEAFMSQYRVVLGKSIAVVSIYWYIC